MEKRTIVERVTAFAGPVLEKIGLEMVDVEYLCEHGRWVLRLSIDRAGGVTLGDCVAATRSLEGPLDVLDLIPHAYHLEVASPGPERPLKKDKDFVAFRGHQVRVTTTAPIGGSRRFQGTLLGLAGEAIQLQLVSGQQMAIRREEAASVRLIPAPAKQKAERS